MVDDLEMQFLLANLGGHPKVKRNHRRRGPELAADGGEMISGNGADRAAHIDDFGRGEIGGKRGEHAATGHRNPHVSEIEKGMTAKKNAVTLYGGNRASGIDGRVALHKNHSGHVSGHEVTVFG